MNSEIDNTLRDWINRRITPESAAWLETAARPNALDRAGLFKWFGLVPRRTGKADLNLSAAELAEAERIRPGWDPSRWSVDQTARTLLVLSLRRDGAEPWVETLDALFAAAAVDELVALYQSMGLWPYPESHRWRAGEGVRTNMKAVFAAVASRNPYPAEQLDEGAWNQMILKCLFVGISPNSVVGIDRRHNPRLMTMLVDYAQERWAARRIVPPELWRCVGPIADDRAVAALDRVIQSPDPLEAQAGGLALSACPAPQAPTILGKRPEIQSAIRNGTVTWTTVSAEWAERG